MSPIRKTVALCLIMALAGCASIVHGGAQDVRVSSNPSGAVVRVNGMATTTPGVLKLERKQTYTLVFEKDGYDPVEIRLNKTVDGWLFGNIVFGGLIGLVIDFASGAAYKLTPGDIDVVLKGTGQQSAKNNNGDVLVFVDFQRLPASIRSRIEEQKIV